MPKIVLRLWHLHVILMTLPRPAGRLRWDTYNRGTPVHRSNASTNNSKSDVAHNMALLCWVELDRWLRTETAFPHFDGQRLPILILSGFDVEQPHRSWPRRYYLRCFVCNSWMWILTRNHSKTRRMETQWPTQTSGKHRENRAALSETSLTTLYKTNENST